MVPSKMALRIMTLSIAILFKNSNQYTVSLHNKTQLKNTE
jgi:hypothetical protein